MLRDRLSCKRRVLTAWKLGHWELYANIDENKASSVEENVKVF